MPRKKQEAVAVTAGGGTQKVVHVAPLKAIVYEDPLAKDKVSTLMNMLHENEEKKASLEPCMRAYNAALDNISTLRTELLTVMMELGAAEYETENGSVFIVRHEGELSVIRPGVKQLQEFIQEKDPEFLTKYESLLADFRKKKLDDILENNKKANAILNPKDTNNTKPPPTFAVEVAFKGELPTTHEAAIVLQIPHLTAIRGVSWYDFRTLKSLEGKQIKCEYEKVTDSAHGDDVRVREGKSYEEMHGWVRKDYGVWPSSKGHTVIDLENNYNRIVDGGDHETSVKELRKNVTETDIEKANALGQLTDGTFRPTRLSVYGIKPGTLQYMKPDGKWEIVPVNR